jgi:hypothetical protein
MKSEKKVDNMPKNDIVVPCSSCNEPKDSGNITPMPMNQNASASENNRKELQDWFANSEYTDIKFWVHPNVSASPDECVAEVVSGVKQFEADKKAGKTRPVSDDEKY